MKQVVGKCSLCGGRVTVPTIWLGVIPPTPTCESCHAVAQAPGPVIPMVRPRPRRSPFSSTGACPDCGCRGAHYCTGGQPPHPGWYKREESEWGGYTPKPGRHRQ